MPDHYRADPALIESIAGQLRGGSGAIEGSASGVPASPDAGAMSGTLGQVLGHLTQAAGEMSTGVAAAAEEARNSADTYAETEAANSETIAGEG